MVTGRKSGTLSKQVISKFEATSEAFDGMEWSGIVVLMLGSR